MPALSCAMIVRDVEQTIETALRSIRDHVDELVVVDTGSVDRTVEICHRYADITTHFDWCDDFSAARQFAHDQCSGDWIFFLDADDQAFGAEHLRSLIAAAPDDMDAYMIRYQLALNAAGVPEQEFWRERLTRKGKMRWVGRVHEVLLADGPVTFERFEPCWVVHHGHGDAAGSLQRNIGLLRKVLQEQPEDTRTLFYLGRDLVMTNQLDEGQEILERYIPLATWGDELFHAVMMVGHALRLQGKHEQAYESDLRLLTVHPLWPQCYFQLSQDCYFMEKWPWCVHFADIGRRLPMPESNLFQAKQDIESGWMIFAAVALYHVGQLDDALKLTREARRLRPDDPHHFLNEKFFENFMAQESPQIIDTKAS